MYQRQHKWLSRWATIERRKDNMRMANTSLYRISGGQVRKLTEQWVGDGKALRLFIVSLAQTGMERPTARQGGSHRAARETRRQC